jgi:hypothetical protein
MRRFVLDTNICFTHVAKASLITTDGDFDHLDGDFIEVLKY